MQKSKLWKQNFIVRARSEVEGRELLTLLVLTPLGFEQ